jgi:hypothetical protein
MAIGIFKLNHPFLAKEKENFIYWVLALGYGGLVAFGFSSGFWGVLNLVLVALAARQGFPELAKMFILTRETNAVARFSDDKEAKKLVLVLAVSAVLYTVAIPFASPLVAFVATLVAVFGSKRVVGPSAQD